MKRINLKSASNAISNEEMKSITGGHGFTCFICHCVDDDYDQSSDDMVWCAYDMSDIHHYIGIHCSSGFASCR